MPTIDADGCPIHVQVEGPEGAPALPPVLDKPATGTVSAWLCRGVTCLPPIDRVDALKKACKGSTLR